jgi:type IV pilus biogenesis protein PilP
MQNKLSLVLLSLWLPITVVQAAEPGLSGIDVGELGRVQSETILFKAQTERNKAERTASGESDVQQAQQVQQVLPQVGGFPTPSIPTTPGIRQPALPVVKQISGSGQKLRATLLYSGGSEIDAQPGSELPEGFRVLQVTLDGVVLVREGRRFPLVFGNQASTTQPQMGLPGLIPGQQ